MKFATYALIPLIASAMLTTSSDAATTISLSTQTYVDDLPQGGIRLADALGGDATAMHPENNVPLVNQGIEYVDWIALPNTDPDYVSDPSLIFSARRYAMNSIPNLYDWAIYDPSGEGFTGPGAYVVGDPGVAYEALFSVDPTTPLSAISGGANISVNTSGTGILRSSNSDWRATDDSGKLGVRLNSGSEFIINASIPNGQFLVHLIGEDRGTETDGIATIDGAVVAIPATNPDPGNLIHTFTINNDSGSDQDLQINWVASGSDVRFSGLVIQVVPEPGSALALAGLGLMGLIPRKRR